jgi:hypothetical protein
MMPPMLKSQKWMHSRTIQAVIFYPGVPSLRSFSKFDVNGCAKARRQ